MNLDKYETIKSTDSAESIDERVKNIVKNMKKSDILKDTSSDTELSDSIDKMIESLKSIYLVDPVMPIDYSNILYYSLKFEKYDDIIEIILNNVKKSELFKNISGSILSDSIKDKIFKFPNLLKSLKENDNVIFIDDCSYNINNEFHVTVLYTGGKTDDRCIELNKLINNKYNIYVTKIGITPKFITLGISFGLADATDEAEVPYYGNDIKHITIGLNKHDFKKIYPKDSFNALLSDDVIVLDKPIVLEATLIVVKKN